MIRFGLRLSVAGGREAITRLALIAVAVAVGTSLLLTTLTSLTAVNRQNARYAWLETGYNGSNAPSNKGQISDLWWLLRADYFHGQQIGRIDLAPVSADAPLPPGLTRLPSAGEYYASPALAALLRRTPADQLGSRYPGRLVGVIGSTALPAPNSLVVIIGHTAKELSRNQEAVRVSRISTTVPSSCAGDCALGVGTDSNGITLILSVVAAALLFPVLIFIGGATRLSATRREQRFAAMRLIGATPRQISVIASVESAFATSIGVLLGFGLFFAARPMVARIPFSGEPFFAGDLTLGLTEAALVAVGIPVAAAMAARLALRRVTISPLGVTRRVTPAPPRAWRILPLLAGIVELAYFAYVRDIGATSQTNTTVEAGLFLAGVLLIMAGLVVAGPWLTGLASGLAARHARRPATLIAARRLADNPQAGFRAISGLVLAVFVGTCATGIITAIAATTGGPGPGTGPNSALVDMFDLGPGTGSVSSVPASTVNTVSAIPGVTGIAIMRDRTNRAPAPPIGGRLVQFDPTQEVISCAELSTVPALGRCRSGAKVVAISPDYGGGLIDRASMADTVWPAVNLTPAELTRLPVDTLFIGTSGSATTTAAATERARTVLDLAYPNTYAAQTLSELRTNSSRLLNGYRQLANVVILTSLPIAGCSLAVNIAGGLADRKRPFSLLRLAGAPLSLLGRVIALEAIAPLLITAVASVGAGLLAAYLFLRAQLHETLHPLSLQFYLVMVAGLAASITVIASTRPLVKRLTGPEIARND